MKMNSAAVWICLIGVGSLCSNALQIPASDEATTYTPVEETTLIDPDDQDVTNFPVVPIEPLPPSTGQPSEPPLRLDSYPGLRVVNSTIVGNGACRCGTSKLGMRIVNGVPARITELPWTVGLARAGKGFFGLGGTRKPFCGGTLINNLYVLTASHCVDGTSPSKLKVLLNLQDDLSSIFNPSSVFAADVAEIHMHQDYSASTIDNDVALIKLTRPVEITDPKSNLAPACLPANNDNDYSEQNATVAGWGTIFSFGPQSLGLQKVDVPVMSNQVCNTETQYKDKISDNMLCAGFLKEGGKDSCQGDSGGPLIVKDENSGRNTLVGIVSWGYACAQPRAPGVYTRVGRYPGWILERTRDAEYCGE